MKEIPKALRVLGKLNTPEKIQDFLNNLPFNHERRGETYHSVLKTLTSGRAHCFEGALVAAAALWLQGEKPLLMDLRTTNGDQDHVVTLYRRKGSPAGEWGAISKTNHPVLRFRDAVYKTQRELAMSYFHEYFLADGTKTLRKYSEPFDLSKTKFDWLLGEEDLSPLVNALDKSKHFDIVPKGLRPRKADKIEREASSRVEYK